MTRLREEIQLKNIPLEQILEEEAPVDEDLIESIEESRQYDPIKVTPVGPDQYRIIGGKRRYLAAKELAKKTITALIIQDVNDEEFVVRTLVDNSGRPNPMDEAQQMQKLRDLGWDNKRIAHVCRYEPSRVERTLKLLRLTSEWQELVKRGEKKRTDGLKPGISFSTGYQIAKLPEEEQWAVYAEWESGKKITEPYAWQCVRKWQASQIQDIFEEELENDTSPGLFIEGDLVLKLIGGEVIEVNYQGIILSICKEVESGIID